LLNVPIAVGLLVLSPMLLDESRDAGPPTTFDPLGAITITAALVLFVDAIVEAPAAGWTSYQTIGLLAGSAALLALFARVESRSAAPLVPLRMFRSPTLVGGNLAMLLFGMCAWGMGLEVAQYAQQVLGYSPLQFGIGTITMTAMAVVGADAAQLLVTRIGARAVAAGGMILLGGGTLLLAQVPVHGTYFSDIFPGLLIFGPGLGGGTVAASVAALAGVPRKLAGLASATNTAALQIGGAFGAAIVSTVGLARTVGPDSLVALTNGYRAGFATCVIFAVVGLGVTALLPGRHRRQVDTQSYDAHP
jgi:Na+/melibiose symporter-like transporter